MLWTDEQQKIAEDTIRYYAERKNASVGYITISEKFPPIIYEKDEDSGETAKITAKLLNIDINNDAMANGYEFVPTKIKQLEQENKELTLGERMMAPINVFSILVTFFALAIAFLFLSFSGFFFILFFFSLFYLYLCFVAKEY